MVMFKRKKMGLQVHSKSQRRDVVAFLYKSVEEIKDSRCIFVWDLDKTYLDTDFGGFRKILKIVFEQAIKKRNVPGTDQLVRSLAKCNKPFPIFFISASPPQMQEKIYEKWMHDRIEPYGFYSKDNLKNLRFGRWARLTNHVGFKIQALMELRLLISKDTKMICWGDDSESDATIYSLFSDICSHKLTDKETVSLLKEFNVLQEQIDLILELRDQRDHFDPIHRVYINLAVDTDPEYYRKYGRRLMAVENSFEVALDLFQRGFLDLEGVKAVAKDLVQSYGFKPFQLEEAYELLSKRSRLSSTADELLRPMLVDMKLLSSEYVPSAGLMQDEVFPLEKDFPNVVRPWVPERIDYLSDY
jgi:hypothetical protein